MPTKEPRVNIVLDKPTREALAAFAVNREVTLSNAAADLIRNALELEEDYYYSALAARRERETTEWISHDAFWKRAQKKSAKPKSRK